MEEKKVALITGASKGIGAAIAKRLAKDGFNLVLGCSNKNSLEKDLKEVEKECLVYGVEVLCTCFDVSNFSECSKMVELVKEKFKTIDVLVNNAGITKDGLLARMTEEDFDKVSLVNFKGVFNMTRLVSAVMLKQKSGRIINISSVVGIKGNAGQFNYCACKAGVIGMTKSAAKELGKRGILVNAIAPGFITTNMTQTINEDLKEKIKENIVLKRFGRPDEIASVASFLAGKDSSYVTGQVIVVDGCLLI